jgi:hypothetical protein
MAGRRPARRGAVGSGLLTGLSTAAVSGAAAVAGALLSRKFGHGEETDGFFAVYAVYLALVLVAGVVRVVVLPRFVRAQADGRLGGEVGTWLLGLTLVVAPLLALALAWPDGIARVLTSDAGARHTAAELLPWLVPAAAAQIYAGILASALATFDDYGTAALGFGGGAIVGLALIATLAGHGVAAWGWGIALSAAIAVALPLAGLGAKHALAFPDARIGRRIVDLGEGIALPVALQLMFVVALRFAAGIGTGKPTTLSYAYLIAAFLVAVTASSVALVSTVPFARTGSSPERVTRHVVATSWLSLVVVAAVVGVFVVAGQTLVRWGLGSSYRGATGEQVGRLVVYLAPWMVVSVALSIAFPLVFVRGRTRWLLLLAAGSLGVCALAEWGGRVAFGLAGVAGGLTVATALALVGILRRLGALRGTLQGLLVAACVCGAVALLAFGVSRAVLTGVPAAVLGLALYSGAILLWRPQGLRAAWAYVRALY